MNNHHYYIPCFLKDGNNRTALPIPNGGDGEVNILLFENGNTDIILDMSRKHQGLQGIHPQHLIGDI